MHPSSTRSHSIEIPAIPMNRVLPPGRQDWLMWAKGLVISGFLIALGFLFGAWFRIGVNNENCLPETFILVGRWTPELVRGAYYTYESRGAVPYPDGTVMVKQLVGMPGDHVRIGNGQVWINGRLAGELTLLPQAPVFRGDVDETIPPGHYFMMGTTPQSYDSRYWGYVREDQFRGRAWPLL